MDKKVVEVLDVSLYAGDIALFLEEELTKNKHQANNLVSATGAHGLVYAQKNPSFKQILQSFYINLPDGMPAVWVGRLKGAKAMRRCYGPDFFKEAMIASANTGHTHFLCGGMDGVADRLKQVCQKKFGAKIVGTYCPPFLPVEEFDYAYIGKQINESKPDFVWIGLSTPKQEQFATRLSKHTKVSYICTVGAAFDFHIGNVKQAPSWIQKIGMEWFFRLLMEPKRLWKRYVEIVPLFIWYNLKEFISRSS
ncbi:WecB/TagA/CpsF family glycosyltransferase [Ekhidna sp. MALMAid0563]|uniref:WecB/TagA/CpsF family glycosyltransferase n=1 Tax=Ekhidna sp. MALMAid0563 TaxID=3143937 RepID=UPI0032DF6EC8